MSGAAERPVTITVSMIAEDGRFALVRSHKRKSEGFIPLANVDMSPGVNGVHRLTLSPSLAREAGLL